MTFDEFRKKLQAVQCLEDTDRETAMLRLLTDDIENIEDAGDRKRAALCWMDYHAPMSGWMLSLIARAMEGDPYAAYALYLAHIDSWGSKEDSDGKMPWEAGTIGDPAFQRRKNFMDLFTGLDDIDTWNIDYEETENEIYMMLMAGLSEEEIAPTWNKHYIGYRAGQVHARRIAETITQELKKLASATWKFGQPVNEKSLRNCRKIT